MSDEEVGKAFYDIGRLTEEAIVINGLADTLSIMCGEYIFNASDLNHAQKIAWSYEALAKLAQSLADKLSEIAP